MQLRGWDYTGRNIGHDLHVQYRKFVDALSSPQFVNHRSWGTSIQEDLAKRIGCSSSGAIRTIKKMFEMLGFLGKDALTAKHEIQRSTLLTKRGEAMYGITCLEEQIIKSTELDQTQQEAAEKEIKKLYEEIYCEALMHYYYEYDDGTRLSPLRATLWALDKYGRLDKWEWYLLNTFILHDDNAEEQAVFDKVLHEYRNGKYDLSMENVVEKPKGHQYIPQYFEYAGLVHVIQRPQWSIGHSQRHKAVKDVVLSASFLGDLYGGKI